MTTSKSIRRGVIVCLFFAKVFVPYLRLYSPGVFPSLSSTVYCALGGAWQRKWYRLRTTRWLPLNLCYAERCTEIKYEDTRVALAWQNRRTNRYRSRGNKEQLGYPYFLSLRSNYRSPLG